MNYKSVALAFILFTASSAAAEPPTISRYETIEDIPTILRQNMGSNKFRESYMNQMLSQLRQGASDQLTLTYEDVEKHRLQNEDRMRRDRFTRILAYDRNFDGMVTSQEIIDTFNFQYNRQSISISTQEREEHLKRRIAQTMKADTDNDGIISLKEMSEFPQGELNKRHESKLQQLLELDTNNDQKLTVDELEMLARKAYATVDTDGNGIIEEKEASRLHQINRRTQQENQIIKASCNLPKPAAGDKVIVFGAYEGKSISNVSIAGQAAETHAIPLEIVKGDEKLFIIATTFSPAIWQVVGDTGRISHLVVGGRSMPEGTANNDIGGSHVNAGVTGVPKEKVSFFHARECGLHTLWEKNIQNPLSGGDQPNGLSLLKRLIGRDADSSGAIHAVTSVKIDGAKVVFEENPAKTDTTTPAGFDEQAWKTFLRLTPAGIIQLNTNDVVSDAPATAYEVLPHWAGIAKLVHDGALVPLAGRHKAAVLTSPGGQKITLEGIENIRGAESMSMEIIERTSGYKIVKNIPYYPAGLYGGYSTSFLIAKGVIPPKGDFGHSKVYCEDSAACPVGRR